MPWIVRGDIDGFFGLALDNLIQLLLIASLCKVILGFSDELVFGRILPGAAISVFVGNVFYSWQARKLSRETGRADICALPYGINTLSVFGHVFLVMLPAKLAAQSQNLPNPEVIAWHAGLIACLGSAVIEGVGAFFAEHIRRATPRAALLSTLAGIALTFIALGFFFRAYAFPEVGLSTLGIILLIYFGRVKFKFGIPGGLVAVLIGTAIAWSTKVPTPALPETGLQLSLHLPIPVIGELLEAFKHPYMIQYLSVIIPMGIFNVVGSLQNIESAEAAGDAYPTLPSLLANCVGSLAATLFGSCFPTTIYIGHPGWKSMGARAGYSVLNGAVLTLMCLTGSLAIVAHYVPIEAGMAIVLWIGIVITAQAFDAVPRNHAPAAVVGLLPGVAAWGAFMAKAGVTAALFAVAVSGAKDATLGGDDPAMLAHLTKGFSFKDVYIHGAFALEQGFIFTAMILAAATVGVIERKFLVAAIWCAVAAALSACGMIHSYHWAVADSIQSLGTPSWPWAIGYLAMGGMFLIAHLGIITEEGEGH